MIELRKSEGDPLYVSGFHNRLASFATTSEPFRPACHYFGLELEMRVKANTCHDQRAGILPGE